MAKGTTVEELVRYLTEGSPHEWKGGGDQAQFDAWFGHLCHWPPNVFAVTAAILHESGLYRVAPDPGRSKGARDEAIAWTGWLFDNVRVSKEPWGGTSGEPCCENTAGMVVPAQLQELGKPLWEAFSHPIVSDDHTARLDLRQGILFLHYVADEACCGLGTPAQFRDWEPTSNGTRADSPSWPSLSHKQLDASVARLSAAGTLSCLEPIKIRILPKKHTPQVGITLRSVSLWVGAVRGEVTVNWYAPARASSTVELSGTESEEAPVLDAARESLVAGRALTEANRQIQHDKYLTNLLLVPWPLTLTPGAFTASYAASHNEFEYEPPRFGGNDGPGAAAYMSRLLAEASRMGCKVDGVVFPEQALDSVGFEGVVGAVSAVAPEAFVLAGVRARSEGGLTNEAWLRVKGQAKPWRQEKHHRWCLDAGQIRQYHLGPRFLAQEGRRYWERMRIMPRSISFAHLRQRLTLCYLICEDLARVEPVAEVVRAVGPNLVIALLLDGPQLEKRWPGRYASIFADDPGSSVLTLSALGMVRRSVPSDGKVSTVVALWKDPRTGTRELAMDPNAHALVLSLATNTVHEFTFDGRDDGGNAGALTFAGLNEIRL